MPDQGLLPVKRIYGLEPAALQPYSMWLCFNSLHLVLFNLNKPLKIVSDDCRPLWAFITSIQFNALFLKRYDAMTAQRFDRHQIFEHVRKE